MCGLRLLSPSFHNVVPITVIITSTAQLGSSPDSKQATAERNVVYYARILPYDGPHDVCIPFSRAHVVGTAEEAIRNTGILQRELKAAQAERTQCGKVEDNSVIRQDAQPTEKMPMRKMDTGPALDQGSGLGSGILRHRNCQEQGNTMLDLKMSPNSTSGPALPSNPLQHVRSTDVAPSSASLKSHALAPDTFLDSPQIFKTQVQTLCEVIQ